MPDANRPDPAIPRPASNLSEVIGRALIQPRQSPAPPTEQLALALHSFQQLVEELARLLGPLLESLGRWLQSPEVRHFAQALAAMAEVMERGPSYCAPYNRELARLGMPPLTKAEQRTFVGIAVLLEGRGALELGQRVPLVEVALAAGRHDIAAALVMERRLTQAALCQLERDNARQQGDLLVDAYLALREQILPSIERRIRRVPMGDVRRIAAPILKQAVRDAYLLKSVRRALVRRLEREKPRPEEAPWDEEAQRKTDQLKQRLAGDDYELDWDIEQALASFLVRPRASELDRRLVAELRQSPGSSARQIALCIGEPVRTVQYHHRQLVGYVRKQLNT